VQKLRWAATIRGVVPLRHAGSVVTYSLPLALIAVPLAPLLGVPLVAASLAIRLSIAAAVDRVAGERSCSHWLLPAIDIVEFAAFLASFVVKRIDWRGSRLTMQRDGRIAA
jgi:ceramide glucosyltransferase